MFPMGAVTSRGTAPNSYMKKCHSVNKSSLVPDTAGCLDFDVRATETKCARVGPLSLSHIVPAWEGSDPRMSNAMVTSYEWCRRNSLPG